MRTFLVLVFLVLLALGFWAGGCMIGGCSPRYSSGDKVGVIVQLSRKGLIWKSWEGQLNMGGFRQRTNRDGLAGTLNTCEFNVAPEAVEKVMAAQISGDRVILVYRSWFQPPIQIENAMVVFDVRKQD